MQKWTHGNENHATYFGILVALTIKRTYQNDMKSTIKKFKSGNNEWQWDFLKKQIIEDDIWKTMIIVKV